MSRLSGRRAAGLLSMLAGGFLVLFGALGLASSEDSSADSEVVEGGSQAADANVGDVPETTAADTDTTTTSTPMTTTTAEETTTTSIPPRDAIVAFVEAFAAATETGDLEFLVDTLHPAVVAIFDEESCREFIETDISMLSDYKLSGEIQGGTRETIAGFLVVTYTAPVTFTFRGEEFSGQATFGYDRGEVSWFTQCG